WAQALLADADVPGGWRARREVSLDRDQGADDVIHHLLDAWRLERRVVVVASSDGGFDVSLAAAHLEGVPTFVVTTGKPARRLRDVAEVHRLLGPDDVAAAAAAIDEARGNDDR